jgi:hypothetical protein
MHNLFENENIFHQIAILMYFFPLRNLTGQAVISDHLLPIFIDRFTILAINKMRWSGRSGEGWSKPAFLPNGWDLKM